jgi:general secretion pathway protein B
MSYILDALRKSEQQRQAIQPDTVTDRLLINPPQPKQKPTKWIIALVFCNVLVIAYFAWFFTQKAPAKPQYSSKAADQRENQTLPTTSAKPLSPPTVTAQNKVAQAPNQALAKHIAPKSPSPSIAQLLEEKKQAEKMLESQRSTQQISPKKSVTVKKTLPTNNPTNPALRAEPYETIVQEKPAALPPRKGTPDLNELPYDVRNSLPNLTINVFSYAQPPEDRFVIINMTKYKTGQLIKGLVTLKEIRPDGIVLQYGGTTFKVERP